MENSIFRRLVTNVPKINKISSCRSIHLVLAYLILGVLILQPLFMILNTSFSTANGMDLLTPINILVRKNLIHVVFNSIWLGVWVVFAATLVALPMAFLMAKTWLIKHQWLDVVLLIPFMTPPYISSMGWVLFMQPRGYLEQILPTLSGVSNLFFTLFGLVMVMSLHLFPFIYLILKNTLLQVSGNLEEAGAVHGGGFFYRLRKIVLPLLIPSYGAGALLIFVKTISEFGTPATLGRRIGFQVLTTEIHRLTSNWPIDFGKASALSLWLLITCMLVWYVQSRTGRRFIHSLVGPKGARLKVYTPGLPGRIMIWGYVFGVLFIAVGIPYFSVMITSLLKLQGYGLTHGNFTLDHYQQIMSWGSRGLGALWASLRLAFFTASIAAIIGVFVALIVVSGKSRWHRTAEFLSLLPNTVPNIVMIVGLILFWNAPWIKLGIYNTYTMVLITYVVLFIPFTVQYVKAAYHQIDSNLLQAGKVFGGTPWYVFRRILFPLIIPGILSGWVMTFIISVRELVASLMILPPGMENSARFIYAQFEQGSNAEGMAMAVISMLSSTLILLAVNRLLPNRSEIAS